MRKLIDLTDQKFGKLKVLSRASENAKNGEARWICICQCSLQSLVTVTGHHLRKKHKTHCGCILNPETQEYLEEIEKRIEKHSSLKDNCIEWNGYKNKLGYGYLSVSKHGKTHPISAHRANWLIRNGKIPAGYEVCHKCDNPSCIRIDHLFLRTHAENMRDCKNKGRYVFGNKHPNSKITELQAQQILDSRHLDISAHDLAKKYNVGVGTIRSIWYRQNWKHIIEKRSQINCKLL